MKINVYVGRLGYKMYVKSFKLCVNEILAYFRKCISVKTLGGCGDFRCTSEGLRQEMYAKFYELQVGEMSTFL